MSAPIGEMVYLKSILTNVHIYGSVTDGATPDQFCATLEIAGENATMSLAALVGPQGPQGQHAFALRLQKSTIDDPEDLPQNLTDDPEDLGKYWIMNHYETINEVQVVTLDGSGTPFTLTYSGQTTSAISTTATASQVADALDALPNLAHSQIALDGLAGGPYTVTFQGTKAGINQPVMTATHATVETTQEGEINLVGARAYIWMGDHYRILMMGSEGPVGPVPRIAWGVQLLDPDGDEETNVVQTGTAYNPSVLLKLKVPRGPQGEAGLIRDASDYDDSEAPQTGQVLMWNGTKFAPAWVGSIIPKPFIVPEAAFNNYEGLSTRAPIGTFPVPALDFPWKPFVWGKIKATGLELDEDPLIIGCEVRLGHPTTGTLVARGFGNSTGWTTLTPHTSTPSSPSVAMTPDNATGLVPANHTGNDGTLYINLYNDGLAGVYLFNKANAQLAVLAVPV
ncbi:hypothetical protein [Mycolicibacterium fortuitum]|uniref:hypothetical protein n=1 Tax=Mycolicibacterium fortuitum TaxID=1766 RepID=UPI0007EBC40E|nr:hypothetical protein [Mycolicibacterium fortuitum]OBF77101.1 hypothetical protein A5751_23275 [Mycolicibacterium fortuitum]